ncbi:MULTISPECIES: TlyA family RNA methyltransferase [Carnobacterium]|uniref:Cell division protein FtsJ n=2 Tax=Carnobacterium inhibens TaxID=147709 RepID=U5S7N6_9LACT|nr:MULTISPECIES: TlyA family RNA methyltransferase [Carnobacterium]AGY81249.1 cell division protein FtsJ [Carnobacterium inhibens subsp. gilichinskyi]MBC9825243.1 TlyA family rRNA (cytidine-2'-O)-methyltransferase [Carnobacterium inhibens]MCM3513006.1 TlyA family RNA methyltransferase [Carnobacterium inhibens]MDN5371016.1 rRNA (cytidine1920-2-O)/16S rRNA (cytidine1409-2-O)-methyltransferase [Carnobacterium sp.]
MKKERVDTLLVKQGLAESVEKARSMIMAGQVYNTKEERIDTAGEKIAFDTQLQLKGKHSRYVSRGGFKLEKAMEVFDVVITDKIMLDIGSSTGGFTDAALQHGAKLSYALDVGTNQLAWKLRQDPRVVVMEQTNFRYCKPEDFSKGRPNLSSIDVSFISLRVILPVLKNIIASDGDILALIKPQFEAHRDDVGEKGIVSDKSVHEQVLTDMLSFATSIGYDVLNLTFSPITGGEGNIEFLAHLKWNDKTTGDLSKAVDIQMVLTEAYATLKTEKK